MNGGKYVIKGIQSLNTMMPNTTVKINQVAKNQKENVSFSSLLKENLEKVNKAQVEADNMTNDFIKGKPVELHEVMIASEKASILLQTTIEVRNKVVEAYQEMMRMQV